MSYIADTFHLNPEPEAPPVADWRDVLRSAASKLERDGWVSGAYESDGRCCAVGAMNVVVGRDASDINGDDRAFSEAYTRLAKFVNAHLAEDEIDFDETIQEWNDEDGRVADTVITAMRECANAA